MKDLLQLIQALFVVALAFGLVTLFSTIGALLGVGFSILIGVLICYLIVRVIHESSEID